jgi:hypothetical protein
MVGMSVKIDISSGQYANFNITSLTTILQLQEGDAIEILASSAPLGTSVTSNPFTPFEAARFPPPL